MSYLDQFVPNVHFEKIPIKNLVSNQDYQRNLSRAHIEKAAENFDIFSSAVYCDACTLKRLKGALHESV